MKANNQQRIAIFKSVNYAYLPYQVFSETNIMEANKPTKALESRIKQRAV